MARKKKWATAAELDNKFCVGSGAYRIASANGVKRRLGERNGRPVYLYDVDPFAEAVEKNRNRDTYRNFPKSLCGVHKLHNAAFVSLYAAERGQESTMKDLCISCNTIGAANSICGVFCVKRMSDRSRKFKIRQIHDFCKRNGIPVPDIDKDKLVYNSNPDNPEQKQEQSTEQEKESEQKPESTVESLQKSLDTAHSLIDFLRRDADDNRRYVEYLQRTLRESNVDFYSEWEDARLDLTNERLKADRKRLPLLEG